MRSHAHFGAWYSRFPGTGPAPADTARGQLMGSCVFVRGRWGGVHAPMSYAAQRWRLLAAIAGLCNANASLAGNQTLAAMPLRSEAQDKTQNSDYCRNEQAPCRPAAALELAL